jgi:small subunit ribosomal protein S15
MSLDPERKAEIINEFAQSEGDSGSPEVQIALFHYRIEQLQQHLKTHRHDQSSRRGLLRLVGQRRRMLAYLRDNEPERYRAIIERLGLRR